MKAIRQNLLVALMGIVAMLLPALLVLATLFGQDIQPLISAYYHPSWDGMFVGTMCAMAICLFSFRGFSPKLDLGFAVVAGFAALGVAFFPLRMIDSDMVPVNYLHLASAVLFMVILGFFCGRFALRRSRQNSTPAKGVHLALLIAMAIGFVVAVYSWFTHKGRHERGVLGRDGYRIDVQYSPGS